MWQQWPNSFIVDRHWFIFHAHECTITITPYDRFFMPLFKISSEGLSWRMSWRAENFLSCVWYQNIFHLLCSHIWRSQSKSDYVHIKKGHERIQVWPSYFINIPTSPTSMEWLEELNYSKQQTSSLNILVFSTYQAI